MTDKKQKKRLRRLILFLGSLLLSASLAQAEPEALEDYVLDQITAGTANTGTSGGVIVGNSSQANINQADSLNLSDEVQLQAKGLNLVNSTSSAVANGVNVWHGGGINGKGSTPVWAVNQVNLIDQEQRRSASLSGYSRPEADTLVQTNRSGSESHDYQHDQVASVTDIVSEKRIAHNDSFSKVDTLIEIKAGDNLSLEANVGQGIAAAGQVDIHFDGGEAEFALAAGGSIKAGAGLDLFGDFVSANANVEVNADFSVDAKIILPEMDIKFNGGGCGVLLGSCEASGTTDETTEKIVDHSTLDTLVETSAGKSQYTEVLTEVYRSPFALNNAQAEYIVLDNSSLVVNSAANLTLSGSAQKDVRAMNVVNAIGSVVANGVNVARNARIDGGGQLGLNQSNVITHGR